MTYLAEIQQPVLQSPIDSPRGKMPAQTACDLIDLEYSASPPPGLYKADLLDLPSPSETDLIPGILGYAEACGLCGRKFAFKTVAQCDMAFSLATGTAWLGHFPVRKRYRVLYCTWETTRSQLRDYFTAMACAKGYSDAELRTILGDWLHVYDTREPVLRVSNRSQRGLQKYWHSCNYDVVMIDHCGKAIDPSASQKDSQARQQGLMAIDSHYGVHGHTTIVHAAHLNKHGNERPSLVDINGAGIAEHCRSVLLLSAVNDYAKGREFQIRMSLSGNGSRSAEFICGFTEGWEPGTSYSTRIIGEDAESGWEELTSKAQSVEGVDGMAKTVLREELKIKTPQVNALITQPCFLRKFKVVESGRTTRVWRKSADPDIATGTAGVPKNSQ